MEKSESIAALAAALSKAQAELEAARMDAVNPYFKSKYATLGNIIEAAKPVIKKHELSVSQFPINNGNSIGVRTLLMHSSGEWISDQIMVPFDLEARNLAQAAGAIISYLRRYSLAAVLGIYAEEDLDAEDAGEVATKGISWPQEFVKGTMEHESVPKGMTSQHAVNLLNLIASVSSWNPKDQKWEEFEQVIGLYRKHRVVAEQEGEKITPQLAVLRAYEEYCKDNDVGEV